MTGTTSANRATGNPEAAGLGSWESRVAAGAWKRLKEALYPRLVPIAHGWYARPGRPAPWPGRLGQWLRMCHQAGQVKSTAILLRYRAATGTPCTRTLGLVFHDAR